MSETRIVFTRQGVLRGIRQALPIVIGTFPFGLVCGVLSEARGLSLLETVLMGAMVFAGTSQILVLEIWSDPAPWAAATLATFVVNIRMAPMGAALAPWLDRLRGLPRSRCDGPQDESCAWRARPPDRRRNAVAWQEIACGSQPLPRPAPREHN